MSYHMDQIISFLKEHGGNHVSHLILLQDKEVYWAQEQKVLIAYKRIANKLVVLGDPIGDELYIKSAIKEFCIYSKQKGLTPIFYQISSHYMHYYHDAGYRFLKLGEEGSVNLENFSLVGKKVAKLRTSFNKFTRSSYSFQVIKPPYTKELLSNIKDISNSWLDQQTEKSFSVVSFSEEYISQFPIALLFDPDKKIIAFATLATDYDQTIIIDLMRRLSNSPPGTMDVLFVNIFNWAKEQGYQSCSLGMAPLSNVGNCEFSFLSEKFLRLFYLYGNSLYKFKGLKEFKNKFACSWDAKYLAYKKTTLPIILIQLFLLINQKPESTFKFNQIKKTNFFSKSRVGLK